MPVYEYKCKKCGQEFEFEQSITDEPLAWHIKEDDGNGAYGYSCGPVYRLISPAAFHLKGPGWAKDGYSSARGKKENK